MDRQHMIYLVLTLVCPVQYLKRIDAYGATRWAGRETPCVQRDMEALPFNTSVLNSWNEDVSRYGWPGIIWAVVASRPASDHSSITRSTQYNGCLIRVILSFSLLKWLSLEASKKKKNKTYNSRDSLVVTHPTTNRPACGLNAVSGWWVPSEWEGGAAFSRATGGEPEPEWVHRWANTPCRVSSASWKDQVSMTWHWGWSLAIIFPPQNWVAWHLHIATIWISILWSVWLLIGYCWSWLRC